MLYSAKVSLEEERILTSLRGQEIRSIRGDGWSLEVESSRTLLVVVPEEIATPDALHPHGDVERSTIKLIPESKLEGQNLLEPDNSSIVQSVGVLSVLISFTPPQRERPTKLLGKVMLPEHVSYGWMYFEPQDICEIQNMTDQEDIALIDLDIGFQLTFAGRPTVVIYTQGFFAVASLNGLPNEDWVKLNRYALREPTIGGGA